jgi:hypothetical protein
VESNHHSTRRQGYSLLSSPMLSVRVARRVAGRVRTGACGAHNPGCFRLHHGHHEAGTTGLEPAASRLTSERSARLSYAPEETVDGGIGSPQPETETLPSDRLRSQLLPIGTPASACPRRHLLTGWPWRLVEASCTLGPALCTSPCSVTSSARPSAGQSLIARVGFEPTVSSS